MHTWSVPSLLIRIGLGHCRNRLLSECLECILPYFGINCLSINVFIILCHLLDSTICPLKHKIPLITPLFSLLCFTAIILISLFFSPYWLPVLKFCLIHCFIYMIHIRDCTATKGLAVAITDTSRKMYSPTAHKLCFKRQTCITAAFTDTSNIYTY